MAQLRSLPADISVFAGRFGAFPAAQPEAFAYLWKAAPELDLDHVEIIPLTGGEARLARHFEAATVTALTRAAAAMEADTLLLLLPAAHDALEPPALPDLSAIGTFRGQVHRMDAAP